jgi:formylmethanofuran:tetrahydromethanopterin formyltransferase
LERFQGDFAVRVRVGYLLAAAGGAALELARLAAAPLTVISAARAAWELVEEVRLLRAAMG